MIEYIVRLQDGGYYHPHVTAQTARSAKHFTLESDARKTARILGSATVEAVQHERRFDLKEWLARGGEGTERAAQVKR